MPKPPIESLIFGNSYCYFPNNQTECIFYSCRFLSLENGASPQLIDEVMNAPYRGEKEVGVHRIALDFNELYSPYKKTPFLIDSRDIDYFDPKELADNEFINVEADERAYQQLCQFLLDHPKITGTVLTANQMAIGIRKKKNQLEFFDPSGDPSINEGHAYIKGSADASSGAAYLSWRFPSSPEGGELSGLLNAWNFRFMR